VAYYADGYKFKLPPALSAATSTGDYALEVIIIDKNKKIVFTFWGYVAVVRV
jgi:hypothetical protein